MNGRLLSGVGIAQRDVRVWASSDIPDALNQTNPSAAAAYRRADKFYEQPQRYIQNVLQHYPARATGPSRASRPVIA